MRIHIPFREQFKEVMRTGKKTCTSRNEKYGDVGDIFGAFSKWFVLTEVRQEKLTTVAHFLYREEGFNRSSEFMDCWNQIHPRKGYVSEQVVWVHIFKMEENDAKK
jgi:rRNA processing protein Gar1